MKGRPTQKTAHPNKNSLHKQFAQTISGQFVQTVPPFPFKISRKQTKEFAQTVCVNSFYLGGWFFGWVAFPSTMLMSDLHLSRGVEVDIDIQCVVVHNNGSIVDCAYYNNLKVITTSE